MWTSSRVNTPQWGRHWRDSHDTELGLQAPHEVLRVNSEEKSDPLPAQGMKKQARQKMPGLSVLPAGAIPEGARRPEAA